MGNEPTDHADVRYERKDIRLGCLLAVIAVALCIVTALGYSVWRFYWWQARVEAKMRRSPYPMAPTPSTKLPPEPRLEQLERMAGVATADVAKRLVAQENILNSYGPTGEKGFVHIPIQHAIEAMAGKLPVRPQPPGPPAKDRGLVGSGESTSGRMFRGEPQ